jgi:hypothetical protein
VWWGGRLRSVLAPVTATPASLGSTVVEITDGWQGGKHLTVVGGGMRMRRTRRFPPGVLRVAFPFPRTDLHRGSVAFPPTHGVHAPWLRRTPPSACLHRHLPRLSPRQCDATSTATIPQRDRESTPCCTAEYEAPCAFVPWTGATLPASAPPESHSPTRLRRCGRTARCASRRRRRRATSTHCWPGGTPRPCCRRCRWRCGVTLRVGLLVLGVSWVPR